MLRRTLFLMLMLPALGRAQSSFYDLSGYIKFLSAVSTYPAADGALYDQLVHARVNTSWYPSKSLRGELDVRVRVYWGDSVQEVPYFHDQVITEYDFANLDAVLWNEKNSIAYAQIDRLWLDYSANKLELTLGRQRIAWGTALVWNVIDLYNPKSVLDFDYEEKPGTDAIRLQYYTGPVSKVEVAAKPGKTADRSIISALYSRNAFGTDFYGVAGIRNSRWVVGGAWAGSILKGGFRGEFLLSQAPSSTESTVPPVPDIFGSSIFAYDRPVASLVLSADYTFPNTFYVHTECLYNSNGKSNYARVFEQEALDAGMLSPARWSLYQEFGYDITPLLRATVYGIFNPVDHSSILVPMMTYSLKTNLDLLVIGQLASGKPLSEFGGYGKSVTLRLKYSF